METKKFTEIFLFILFVVLLHSYIPTILETLSANGSADFQWQPTKCTFDGVNHYEAYLSGSGKCQSFMSQTGEYAQGLYIILYPFTIFEWETAKSLWFLLNIFLIFILTFSLCKKFKVGLIETYLIIFFIYYCIIVRVNLVMGQQTIFTLFFLSLPFIYKSRFTSILSGICYFKYNIGYGLFFLYLISREYKKLFFSTIPIFFGLIVYCFVTNTNIFENFTQPFELMISKSGLGSNSGKIFLFSFIRDVFNFNEFLKYLIIGILTLTLNLYFIYKISKLKNDLLILSSLCLLILISTPHWSHDNILIIPLLIYSIKYYEVNTFISRINLASSIYFLHLFRGIQIYFDKLLDKLSIKAEFISSFYPYIDLGILFLILILNIFYNPFLKEKNLKI